MPTVIIAEWPRFETVGRMVQLYAFLMNNKLDFVGKQREIIYDRSRDGFVHRIAVLMNGAKPSSGSLPFECLMIY